MPSPLGDKIRALRKEKKLSLERLAELTESSKSYIWELENKDDPKPSAEKIGKIAWRPLVFIVGSNVIFGILLGGLPSLGIPAMGLIVATYGVVLVAAQAGDQFRIKEVLILATILAVLSYVAFIKLLKLQFPVWPSFIVG